MALGLIRYDTPNCLSPTFVLETRKCHLKGFMPKYYCYKCHSIWSSGGSDFKVEPCLCPQHKAEGHVTLPVLKPLGMFRAQRERGMLINQPITPRTIGILGQ